MAAVPITYNTAMAVHKTVIHNNEDKDEFKKDQNSSWGTGEPTGYFVNTPPAKYNGKLMNSIWGLYNRYASPSFKKNSESNDLAAANKPLPLVAWLGGRHQN